MAANKEPVFVLAPKSWAVSIATGNTARDGSGTVGTVATAASNGSRIDRVNIVAAVTTTAGVVRLFLYDGSTYYLLSETLVTAITPSATVAVYSAEIVRDDGQAVCELPSGWSLRATTHNSETFKVIASGGDY